MRRNVTFYLGPAPAGAGLTSRRLVITRMPKAGDDHLPLTAFYDTSSGGTTEFVTTPLTDDTLWQATLLDTKTSGEVARKLVLNFNTGSLQFPGPAVDGGFFRVHSMEDLSSSSASSLNSSSSSVSSNSSSNSSSSSSSRSSASSASSASSINSSSSSASSINSSSSSSSSLNSSSSSVSSSSVSSSSSSSVSSSSSSASSSS